MRLIIVILALLPFVSASQGVAELDSANRAYSRSEYEKAAQLYEEVLLTGKEAAEVYYNLGNAYFKSGSLGKAILNYERAHKLAPDDEDINFNLDFASEKVTDKIDPAPQLFLTEWKSGFASMLSETGWSILCITVFTLTLAMIALYITGRTKPLRQLGFWSGIALLLVSILSFTMARSRYRSEESAKEAIVTVNNITVKGSPSAEGTKLFIIHEGTKVKIEEDEGEWLEVKIANGNVGWVPATAITPI